MDREGRELVEQQGPRSILLHRHEAISQLLHAGGRNQYSNNEKAWEDHWEELGGTIYSGKECGGKATEILTTGIQRLHADPLLFLLTDPEYFEFVTRTLNPQ